MNVFVPKIIYTARKPSNKSKDVEVNDFDNITQTLETMNTRDNPPSENNINKTLSEKLVLEKPIDNPTMNIDIKNILIENVSEDNESSEEELNTCQDDGNKDDNNNVYDIPDSKENESNGSEEFNNEDYGSEASE